MSQVRCRGSSRGRFRLREQVQERSRSRFKPQEQVQERCRGRFRLQKQVLERSRDAPPPVSSVSPGTALELLRDPGSETFIYT